MARACPYITQNYEKIHVGKNPSTAETLHSGKSTDR